METKKLGEKGEDEASQFLKNKGYKILERNWRVKLGEIDIVASHKGAIVFIEVKTRILVDNAQYFPEDNIDQRKKRKLKSLGKWYLNNKNIPMRLNVK